MPDPLYVLFACNDPETGEPTGRVTGIDLWDAAETETVLEVRGSATFEVATAPPRVRIDAYWVGARWFPLLEPLQGGVGTPAWSAAHMAPEMVARMLEHLRDGSWEAVDGLTVLVWQFRWFSAETLREALEVSE